MLHWFHTPKSVPFDVKRLIAEIAWGKRATGTTLNHWDLTLTEACSQGRQSVIEWKFDSDITAEQAGKGLIAACRNGHLITAVWILNFLQKQFDGHTIKAILPNVGTSVEEVLKIACVEGHRSIAELSVSFGAKGFSTALRSACSGGQQAMVDWLLENGAMFQNRTSDDAWRIAYVAGELSTDVYNDLRWSAPSVNGLLEIACKGGHLETAQWSHTNGATEFDEPFATACTDGHLEIVQWLHTLCTSYGCSENRRIALRNACSAGQLTIAKWALEQLQKRYGQLYPSEYCRKQLNDSLDLACRSGHLEIARWLRAEGATSVNSALLSACKAGFLEIAKWAFEEGATVINKAMRLAYKSEHIEIAKWARTKGATKMFKVFKHACLRGDLAMARWAHGEQVVLYPTQSPSFFLSRALTLGKTKGCANIREWALNELFCLNVNDESAPGIF